MMYTGCFHIMVCNISGHVDEEPSITQPISAVPSLSASELRRKENEARQEAMRSKRKTAMGKIGEYAQNLLLQWYPNFRMFS